MLGLRNLKALSVATKFTEFSSENNNGGILGHNLL